MTEVSADRTELREYVREWFQKNTPPDWRSVVATMDEYEQIAWQRDWLQTLSRPGFHAPHVPKEFGGGGYDIQDRAVIYEEWAHAEAPALLLYSVSLHHMPSTLLKAGTPQQQAKYVRDGLSGTVWCQGFSEPEAGSDLAALRTTATYDPERRGYTVNGRKIWSSHAMHASYCLLLARTSSDGPKQRGITYLIADMRSTGIAISPIVQSTGDREFCEVTFDDVWVPESDRIGAEGEGWQIAQSTLTSERGPLALEIVERIDVARRALRRGQLAGELGDPGRANDDAMITMATRCAALSCMAHDMIDTIVTSGRPSSLSSVVKVASSDLMRQVVDRGSLDDGLRSLSDQPPVAGTSWFSGNWFRDFVHSWAWSIGAGSNEIQRNIIADRVLSMPRDGVSR